MALIIKGDMPKGCNWFDENGKHRFCKVNAFCDCEIYTRGERPSDCPIIGEIPDEHGDLIERSPLVQTIKDEWQKIHEETGYDVKGVFWNKLVEIIEHSAVVVEASK